MSPLAKLFHQKYLEDTPYQKSLDYYISTIPPRTKKTDKHLASVMSRVLLRGMIHEIEYPTISSFTINSDFSDTVITAKLILDAEGTASQAVATMPQFITRLTTHPVTEAVYKAFAVQVIEELSKDIK